MSEKKTFFAIRVVCIWNSLPEAVVLSNNVSIFKHRFAKFNIYKFVRYS